LQNATLVPRTAPTAARSIVFRICLTAFVAGVRLQGDLYVTYSRCTATFSSALRLVSLEFDRP
jgi:hypothetical protein